MKAKVTDIVDFESGELDEEQTAEFFQKIIDDGSVWRLQGSYGRTAMDLLRAGLCVLGEKGHRDYWGNYVPSRTEVAAGTLGSVEYAKEQRKKRA
jgi:hypothetical protein